MPVARLSRPHPFSRLSRFVASMTSVLLLANSLVPAALGSEAADSKSVAAQSTHDGTTTPRLRITSPTLGATETGPSIQVTMNVGAREDTSTLEATLNGHDISGRLHSSSCTHKFCTMEGTVSPQDGLKKGPNLLAAQVDGLEKTVGDSQRITFDYQETGSTGASGNVIQYFEPQSIGISTVGNGGSGNTWINLTTGNQAGVNDSALQNIPLSATNKTISVSYPDSSLPINCPGWTFQAIILDRTQPSAPPETATCVNSEAEMESAVAANLGRPLDSGDLIIFGTTPGHFANRTLDTSPIGGTNWTAVLGENQGLPSLWYYTMIGVKGATPGTAHENYTTQPGPDTPFQYASFLQGTLMQDKNGNFNYIPSDEREIQVVSGAKPTLQVGGQSYAMPSNSSSGAFWVMVLDRFLLQPINYSAGSWTQCGYTLGNQACGGVFDVHKDGGLELSSMLAGVSPLNMVILVSQGCPFDNVEEVSSSLSGVFQYYGGMQYTLEALNTAAGTCAYSLVTKNNGNNASSLSPGVALSANQFKAQNQSGSIHGYLARDNQGLYQIAMSDQMIAGTNGASPSPAVDYTFERTASSLRQDWPVTDTTGHLAAYHDISQQLMTDPQVDKTGSYIFDVRHFYPAIEDGTANNLTGLIDLRLSPTATNPVTQSAWDTASPQEFRDARNEILNEVSNLNSAMGYLTGKDGNAGVRGLLNGTNDQILDEAFGVASAIGDDEDNAAQQNVNASGANILNLAAGVTSLAGALAAPLIPEVGVFMGVFSGALWTGSAGVAPLSGTLPGPESQYDVQLAAITNNASTYSTNVLNGYDSALDNIFSDGAKLATIAALTSNSDSNWNLNGFVKGDGLSDAISAGEARSLWFQVLPGLYGIRYNPAGNFSDPATFGSYVYGLRGGKGVCVSVYSSPNSGPVPATSQVAYPTLGNTSKFDTYFMALGPNPQQPESSNDVKDFPASSDLTTLLTTTQSETIGAKEQAGLNIPPMLLYTSGNLNYHAPLYFDFGPGELCDAKDYGEVQDSFTITGPSAGVVGQRVGSFTITPVGDDGHPNTTFNGTATVTLSGPANIHSHTNVSFHGKPETVSFTAPYPEVGVYTLKVSYGALDVTKQITATAASVEEHLSLPRSQRALR